MNKQILVTAMSTILPLAVISGSSSAQTLEESVLRSLKSNPEVAIALDRYNARRASVIVANGGYRPNIDLQAGIGYENSDNTTTRASGDHSKGLTRQELSVNLRQMLFDGYRTQSDVQRAEAEATADRYELQDTAENIALRAAEVYLENVNNQRILSLAEENLESHKAIKDKIQLRVDSGIGSTSDLSQVQGRLARAQSNLVAASNNLLDSHTNFFRVVGENPQQLQLPAAQQPNLPESVVKAEEIAMDQHPALLQAAEDIRAANEKIRIEKSSNYPQLSFELGASANNDLDGSEGHDNDVTAMLRVSYNLYSGGRTTGRIKQASEERSEAKDIQRSAARQVVEGLNLAWNAYQSIDQQLQYLRIHVEESRKTLAAYTKQFELGRRSLMDLLDTENEVFEAERSYFNAEKDWLLAQYRVLNASGQLLQTLEIDNPAGNEH
ncbi:MAG: TolC family outer membrane protein [Motiliproteus sp.]|nr:TolC family outer membrane protein [Motiliproteus sp.]MCW9052474.1 TolC family outer membrane protein [Motiliproteus sp.]